MIKVLLITLSIFTTSYNCLAQNLDLNSARNIRDPFKIKYRRKMGRVKARREKFTSFSNKLTTDNLRLDSIRVTGIYMGKDPRAIIKTISDTNSNNSESIIIKEGMKIGPDQVEVKAILPGGVVLVEKIINVYDEEEYLETILPLSE